VLFWLIKILTTGMGETASDFLNRRFDPMLVVPVTGLLLAGLLAAQIRSRDYRHWLYWSTVTMVAVFGTMAADALHVVLGVDYATSSLVLGCTTAVVFAAWRLTQPTIAVHSITTRPRECFYWAAVGATFALGTAVGDLIAEKFALGYWVSAAIFGGAIALVTVAHFGLKLNAVLAFWLAYILTRPLGASIGDGLSQPTHTSGLGLGTTTTSYIFLGCILALVTYLTITKRDQTRPEELANA